MDSKSIMNIEKGEEIAAMLVSGHINGTGYYKFLAKKKANGKYEWAHFVQRDSGMKEKMYKGETDTKDQLNQVAEVMNRTLVKIFGSHAEMKTGSTEVSDIHGNKLKPCQA